MMHIPDEAWIDFVRGLSPPRRTAELKRHVDECAKCRETHRLWRAVLEIAQKEEEYRPSEQATRRAKALYGLRYARKPLSRMRARLIFDSFREPLTEGVRNSHITTRRQLQYELGPLLIDIELSRESGGSESATWLAGHVSNRDDAVSHCRVVLVRGKRFTAQTNVSRVGEFHFELGDGKTWKLLFELEAQRIVTLSLPDMNSRPASR